MCIMRWMKYLFPVLSIWFEHYLIYWFNRAPSDSRSIWLLGIWAIFLWACSQIFTISLFHPLLAFEWLWWTNNLVLYIQWKLFVVSFPFTVSSHYVYGRINVLCPSQSQWIVAADNEDLWAYCYGVIVELNFFLKNYNAMTKSNYCISTLRVYSTLAPHLLTNMWPLLPFWFHS